jgi:hypothetical protein
VSDAARLDGQAHEPERELGERTHKQNRSAPVPVMPGTPLTGPAALALQQSAGNSAVLRLLRSATRESDAIGDALGPSAKASQALLQRQHPPSTADPPTVDPAVKAMWGSTVVAPLQTATETAAGATIQDEENLLKETHKHIETARANVKTTAPLIKDDPALKGRMELLNASLLRVANKIVILVSPQSVTFKVVAQTAQHVARDAAQVGSQLRPASKDPTTTSPKTSTAILRALWKANVSDKLKPLQGKLAKGAAPEAAAAAAVVKAAAEHVWALVPEYAATDEAMAAPIARVGHRLGDFDNQLMFLAEGKKPKLDDLAKDVEGRKAVAEGFFS